MKHAASIVSLVRRIAFFAVFAASLAQATPLDLKVMTQNMFFGTDLAPLATATPATLPFIVAAGFAEVVASNPAGRIARIADEIAAAQPHIVGLQEAVTLATRTPSLLTGFPGPEVVAFDFLPMLLGELAARGQSYTAVAVGTGINLAAPGFDPFTMPVLTDVRFTDREAILVRTDLPLDEFKVLAAGAPTFAATLPVTVGGVTVQIPHTYPFVDVQMGDIRFRAVTTHLEPTFPPVQVAQSLELISFLNGASYPQIALGDFNSRADGSTTASYGNMLAAGFKDTWLEKGIGPGFTCCQAEDLLNIPSLLSERVDFVFHRDGFRTLGIDLLGEEPGDRIATGQWPSDHAGLLATLAVVPEPGTMLLLVISLGALTLTRRRPVLPALV